MVRDFATERSHGVKAKTVKDRSNEDCRQVRLATELSAYQFAAVPLTVMTLKPSTWDSAVWLLLRIGHFEMQRRCYHRISSVFKGGGLRRWGGAQTDVERVSPVGQYVEATPPPIGKDRGLKAGFQTSKTVNRRLCSLTDWQRIPTESRMHQDADFLPVHLASCHCIMLPCPCF